MKTIFGGGGKAFELEAFKLTRGKVYFNWSLTLKTKTCFNLILLHNISVVMEKHITLFIYHSFTNKKIMQKI